MHRLLQGVALTAVPYVLGSLIGSWVASERAVRRELAWALDDDQLADILEEWANPKP